MKRFTVLSEFTVSVALALVLAFALTGCRSGDTEEDSFENGRNTPDNGVVPPAPKYEGPFVKADAKGSVINLIKAAADGSLDDSLPEGVTYNQGALVFNLKAAAAETVSFDQDYFGGEGGLVLTHTGNTDTDTSPASVTIDGGRRVIDLTGKTGGIIYGNNAELSLQNTASSGGHAVAVGGDLTKKREGTADVDLHWPLKKDVTDNNWD